MWTAAAMKRLRSQQQQQAGNIAQQQPSAATMQALANQAGQQQPGYSLANMTANMTPQQLHTLGLTEGQIETIRQQQQLRQQQPSLFPGGVPNQPFQPATNQNAQQHQQQSQARPSPSALGQSQPLPAAAQAQAQAQRTAQSNRAPPTLPNQQRQALPVMPSETEINAASREVHRLSQALLVNRRMFLPSLHNKGPLPDVIHFVVLL
jgi:hypothetical protein